MVAADVARFKQAFNRLAVATRLPADQADAATQRIYFDGLSDLPIEAVETAADELERNAQWFPKVAEWRTKAGMFRRATALKALPPAPDPEYVLPSATATAKDIQAASNDYLAMIAAGVPPLDAEKGLENLLRALMPPRRAEPWRYDCDTCHDGGWEMRTCYPDRPTCGMKGCHGAHEHTYTVRCGCWYTNRTIQRHRAATFGQVSAA